jgi:hypothetical protein
MILSVITVAQSALFEALYESGETGLVGTVQVAIIDNDGNVVYGPTINGITENMVGLNPTGVYTGELTAPADLGQFTIVWSRDGSFDPITVSIEDLIVLTPQDASASLPPIETSDGSPLYGPCASWTDVDDIAACCTLPETSNNFELINVLAAAGASATQLLYELSGRQFSGLCQRKVRPCRTGCTCDYQILSRGHVINWGGDSWYCEGTPCGCRALSRVKLSGYPVRRIIEVKIDGVVVDPGDYRLDERRYLTAMNGTIWPGCQRLDLDDTETGTFSVSYTYGQTPPQLALSAASALACEIYKQCAGEDCALPTGTTRVTRQGITIERTFFQRDLATGVWRTGMPVVDGFLNAINPHGLMRRPTFWAPGQRYARGEGI